MKSYLERNNWTEAKQELLKMLLYDKIWLKVSQSLACIDEEVPRFHKNWDKLPTETIRIFVMETRRDLNEFDKAVAYVNSIGWPYRLSRPEWFRYDKEFSDADLEDELEHLEEHEVEGLDNYDSFIEKLWTNVRGHTNSFMDDEEAKMATMFESEQTREPEDDQSEGMDASPVQLDF